MNTIACVRLEAESVEAGTMHLGRQPFGRLSTICCLHSRWRARHLRASRAMPGGCDQDASETRGAESIGRRAAASLIEAWPFANGAIRLPAGGRVRTGRASGPRATGRHARRPLRRPAMASLRRCPCGNGRGQRRSHVTREGGATPPFQAGLDRRLAPPLAACGVAPPSPAGCVA
jgi:hypothetical protein